MLTHVPTNLPVPTPHTLAVTHTPRMSVPYARTRPNSSLARGRYRQCWLKYDKPSNRSTWPRSKNSRGQDTGWLSGTTQQGVADAAGPDTTYSDCTCDNYTVGGKQFLVGAPGRHAVPDCVLPSLVYGYAMPAC